MLQPLRNAFQKYATTQTFIKEPTGLSTPIDYFFGLGGKRVRPLLCLLSYQLYRDDFKRALPQALSVEMFHNFSLVHDDIMDEAPLRRGKKSTHRRFGLNSAILSGDAMLILTYQYLIKGFKDPKIVTVLRLFSKTALQICRGQQYDMDFESQTIVAIEDYLRMIKLKTAVLLGTSMALGGLRASATNKDILLLRKCGISMGMAFQLQDDVLDAFGDPEKTGKQRGGDILQNKKTFLYLKALELGNQRTQMELNTLFQPIQIDADEKIRRVMEIYQALDVERHANSLKNRFVQKGLQALEKVNAGSEKKIPLQELFDLLLDRDR